MRRPALLIILFMIAAVLFVQQPLIAGTEPCAAHVENPEEHSWRDMLEQTARRQIVSEPAAVVGAHPNPMPHENTVHDWPTQPDRATRHAVHSAIPHTAPPLVLLQVRRC